MKNISTRLEEKVKLKEKGARGNLKPVFFLILFFSVLWKYNWQIKILYM